MEEHVTPDSYEPVEVDENTLLYMRYEEVFIVDLSHVCPTYPKKFYKNMLPDAAIVLQERWFFLQVSFTQSYSITGLI